MYVKLGVAVYLRVQLNTVTMRYYVACLHSNPHALENTELPNGYGLTPCVFVWAVCLFAHAHGFVDG